MTQKMAFRMTREAAEGPRPEGDFLLQGERVVLRPFRAGFNEEEVARQHRWDRDEEVLRWSGGYRTELTIPEYRRMLERRCRDAQWGLRNFAILNEKGELIGRVSYYNVNWHRKEAELGIVLGEREQWSRGYGREAIMALLAYLFVQKRFERVYLGTFPDNIRAQRCFAACGFKEVGRDRRLFIDAGWQEEITMEVLRADFLARWCGQGQPEER